MDLGLSIPNCLGHSSECLDMCGRLCVNSNSRALLHEDLLRHSRPRALGFSHLVFKHRQEQTLQSCCCCCCCYEHATVFAIHSLYLLMSVYGSQNPQELHDEVYCKRFFFFFLHVRILKSNKKKADMIFYFFFCSTQVFYLLIFFVAADFGVVQKANHVIYKPGGQKRSGAGRHRCSLCVYNPVHSQISNYIMGTDFIF